MACLVLDATQPFGRGDQWVADRLPPGFVVVVNKIDRARRARVAAQLAASSAACPPRPASRCRPARATASARSSSTSSPACPKGRAYYPADMVADVPDETRVAELVREQLLAVTHDELPYSIATQVTEWEWPRIRVEIVVERESQKGMVIGKGGAVLKQVGTAARPQLPAGHPPRAVRHRRQGLAAPSRPGRALVLKIFQAAHEIVTERSTNARTARTACGPMLDSSGDEASSSRSVAPVRRSRSNRWARST